LSARSRRPAVPTSLPIVYLVLGVVATGVYFLLSGTSQDTLYDPVSLSSVVAIPIGVRRYHPRHEGDRV